MFKYMYELKVHVPAKKGLENKRALGCSPENDCL